MRRKRIWSQLVVNQTYQTWFGIKYQPDIPDLNIISCLFTHFSALQRGWVCMCSKINPILSTPDLVYGVWLLRCVQMMSKGRKADCENHSINGKRFSQIVLKKYFDLKPYCAFVVCRASCQIIVLFFNQILIFGCCNGKIKQKQVIR